MSSKSRKKKQAKTPVKVAKPGKIVKKGTKTPTSQQNPVERKETPRKHGSKQQIPPAVGDWVRPDTQAKHWAARVGKIIGIHGRGPEACAQVRFQYLYSSGAKVQPEQWVFPLRRLLVVSDFSAIVKTGSHSISHTYDVASDEIAYEEI